MKNARKDKPIVKKDRGNVEPENQSRGTASLRVPHLEKENMRRVNPINDLVH